MLLAWRSISLAPDSTRPSNLNASILPGLTLQRRVTRLTLRGLCTTMPPASPVAPALDALQFTVHESGDTAKASVEEIFASGSFCIFSDGSSLREGAGAAAVARSHDGKRLQTRRLYLGTRDSHDQAAFEAEIVGTILALDIIRGQSHHTSAYLFVDCQRAINAIRSPTGISQSSTQHLLCTFHQELLRILNRRLNLLRLVHIHWVPGHEDIPGNDCADSEAKRAAQGNSLALELPIRLQKLSTAFHTRSDSALTEAM